jgi:hypothetical protein
MTAVAHSQSRIENLMNESSRDWWTHRVTVITEKHLGRDSLHSPSLGVSLPSKYSRNW